MSISEQLLLNLRPRVIDDGKKMCRLSCTCSDDFKDFIEKIARLRKTTISELMYEYVLDGMKKDITEIYLPAPHLDKTLRQIIAKT